MRIRSNVASLGITALECSLFRESPPTVCLCSQIYCHLLWPATDLKSLLICCHVSVEPVERWQNVPYWMLPGHPSHDPWEFTLLIDLNLLKYATWISTQTPIYNCQCSFQQRRVGSRKLHWDHRSTLLVLQVCEKSFCCMFLLWAFKLLSSIISLSACRLYTLSVYWVFLKASPNYGLCKYAQYICMNEIDKMLNLFEQ